MSFLPGWFPGAVAAHAAATPSVLVGLAQHASATSLAATITGPATIQAGDLLVLWDYADAQLSEPPAVVPSGFTIITNNTLPIVAIGTRLISSLKIANGSEAGASLQGMTPGNGDLTRKALYVFRGNVPIATATVLDVASEYTDANPAAQTVNALGATPPLVVIGAYRSQQAIDPRTFSPVKDGEINPVTTLYLAYKIFNSSPANVTVDMDDEGTGNGLASFFIQCS